MIGSLLIGAAKFTWGCVKLGFKATKAAVIISRGLFKSAKRTFKSGKKLSSNVMEVVRASRAIARESVQATQPTQFKESNLFTKPSK